MVDTFEFALNVLRGDYISVGKMSEVELHTGLEAPLEGDFINGDGALLLA